MPHTADVAVRVTASELSDLFAQATRAMFEIMFGECWDEPEVERIVEIENGDVESLLWEWLSTVLGWSEVDRAAYFEAEVQVGPRKVSGRLAGPSVEGRELVGPPIKAVTMHDLEVSESSEGWSVVIVFDI